MSDGPPVAALEDTPSTGRSTSTQARITMEAPAIRVIVGGLVLLFAWQTVLLGLTSTYAEHAAVAGARGVAAHGYRRPQARVEVQRLALARVRGHWADKGHVHFAVDRRNVKVTLDVPALLPGLHTPWNVSTQARIHHLHGSPLP